MSFSRTIINNLKNLQGFRTKRKLIVFSVDDYGNVRVDSSEAKSQMEKAGLKAISRFDHFDTLETREDLEMLFDTLQSVKDKNGNHAVFTPYSLPCNIDFERMAENGYNEYLYEQLPATYEKKALLQPKAYEGTWSLWKEGMKMGLLSPQFHGREHFNVRIFGEKLKKKDKELLVSLQNRSYANIITTGYSTIGATAAFEFWDFKENELFKQVIKDGLNAFENVFGYRATNFNAPGAPEHHILHNTLVNSGIKYLDTPWIKIEHQGFGKNKKSMNYTGKQTKDGLLMLARNVAFEPGEIAVNDWVGNAMNQIHIAFRLNKPAIISSHRVNFCGHIDPKNREYGLIILKQLLRKIKERWPDVEFIAADELGKLVDKQ